MIWRRGKALLFLALLLCWAPDACLAAGESADPGAREQNLKAAFLYNFLQFVDFSARTDGSRSDLELCLFVDAASQRAYAQLRGQRAGSKVVSVTFPEKTADLGTCHVVFFAEGREKDRSGGLSELTARHVLTVGETPGFCSNGGTIRFMMQDNRLRFEINPGTAQKAGLALSPKLLDLAAAKVS